MSEKRPVLKLRYSFLEKAFIVLSAVIIIINFIIVIRYWHKLPNIIPTHYDAVGNVNGTGGRGSILILPIMGAAIFVMLTFFSRFPQYYNYPFNITEKNAKYQYKNARKLMLIMNLEIACCFSYISLRTIYSILTNTSGLGILFLPIFLILIFGTTGYFIWRMFKKTDK